MQPFTLEIIDGRNPGENVLPVSEPFAPGTEDDVAHALDTLHLRAVLRYPDGSFREFLPYLPSRFPERVYPPASCGKESAHA